MQFKRRKDGKIDKKFILILNFEIFCNLELCIFDNVAVVVRKIVLKINLDKKQNLKKTREN